MLSQIHEKLMQARERLRTRQKLDAMLTESRVLLENEGKKCRTHRERLESEKADVDNLEGYSLVRLFYTLLGTKEERLSQERQEYLAANLKYEEASQAQEAARVEVQRLEKERDAYKDADLEYASLLGEKERLLVDAGDGRAETLLQLVEQLGELQATRKELEEAVQAGESARNALEKVRTELQSAENWGTWDMIGGDTFATWMKHSRIDTARQFAHAAQQQLRLFQQELADAGQRLSVSLEIDGFTSFADYFFDGLIVDWVVQSKIQNASAACSNALSQVRNALAGCRARQAETARNIEAASERRWQLLEQE